MNDLVVAMTGASGTAYGIRLVEVLVTAGRTVHLLISPAATQVFQRELGVTINLDQFDPNTLFPGLNQPQNGNKQACDQPLGNVVYHDYRDYSANIASGSFLTDGMVVCPCSMGTLASIATGLSQNLIHRAADVHLKERRKLIVVPRETPLSVIALDNMKRLAEAGGIVLPAMPGFYHNPKSIADMVDFVVARICDQLKVHNHLVKRWGCDPETPID
jgi:flavin prenyltransferase